MSPLRPLADQGDPEVQFFIGTMCEDGRGGSADRRDAVAAMMTPAQIEEAQKLVREWKPK